MNYRNKYLKYKSKYLLLQKAGYVDMKTNEERCKIDITNKKNIFYNLEEFKDKSNIKCLDLSVKNISGKIQLSVINEFTNLEK